MIEITSRDNLLLKNIRRLAQDPSAYRKQGKVWLEGDHLCRAARDKGVKPLQVVLTQGLWQSAPLVWGDVCEQVFVVPDALFATLSSLESPAQMGFVINCLQEPQVLPHMPTVVLDRVQDAGNVGAILRCASAFGFKQVLAMKGTAALWSAKVLRAGMGAHFGMNLLEGGAAAWLSHLDMPLITTSSHQGPFLHQLVAGRALPSVCAWVLGHEGQGVSEEIMALAQLQVRIAQPGGEESLNVASAAAICLYASACSDSDFDL
jgi:TrmH family RNA methyltransferase